MYTPNDPIVESSNDLVFAPYNFKYNQLESHAKLANLLGEYKDDDGKTQTKFNKWNQIFDFTKQDTPNFKLISVDKFKLKSVTDILPDIESSSDYIFELPKEFGGNLDSTATPAATDSLMAFDIKTGAEEAQKAFDEKQCKQDFSPSPIRKLVIKKPSKMTKQTITSEVAKSLLMSFKNAFQSDLPVTRMSIPAQSAMKLKLVGIS